MITKRSYHIPMFTIILMKKVTVIFLLSLRLQNNCGETTLQNIISQ